MSVSLLHRPAVRGDLPAIDHIERASFGNPWPRDAYVQELDRPEGELCVAALGERGIAGYACVWHIVGEAHLLRLAVDPRHRRGGIGRDLLRAIIARARAAGCVSITLEVAASNGPAQGLYRGAGFAVIGCRRGYYRVPPDDAVIMQRSLSDPRKR